MASVAWRPVAHSRCAKHRAKRWWRNRNSPPYSPERPVEKLSDWQRQSMKKGWELQLKPFLHGAQLEMRWSSQVWQTKTIRSHTKQPCISIKVWCLYRDLRIQSCSSCFSSLANSKIWVVTLRVRSAIASLYKSSMPKLLLGLQLRLMIGANIVKTNKLGCI